jgi:excisionase family DNA binding protein
MLGYGTSHRRPVDDRHGMADMTGIQSKLTGRVAHSIAECCVLTGIGRDTIYGAIRAGKLVARKLGRRTLVTDDDLRLFLEGLPKKRPKQSDAA